MHEKALDFAEPVIGRAHPGYEFVDLIDFAAWSAANATNQQVQGKYHG
jgi:hypothetical protein